MSSSTSAVVVTGGGSGIGRACVLALAEAGRAVAAWDIDAAGAEVDLFAHAVQPRIFPANLNRFGVGVTGFDARIGPHLRGRDRQNTRACAHIKKTSAAKIFLDRFQAEPRRFVRAGAKGHAGLDANNYSVD